MSKQWQGSIRFFGVYVSLVLSFVVWLGTEEVAMYLQVRQVLTGLMGFMMYKLALVGCSAVPSPPYQHATEEERLI